MRHIIPVTNPAYDEFFWKSVVDPDFDIRKLMSASDLIDYFGWTLEQANEFLKDVPYPFLRATLTEEEYHEFEELPHNAKYGYAMAKFREQNPEAEGKA